MSNSPGHSNKLHGRPTGLPRLLTLNETAEAAAVSVDTIRRRIADGTLVAVRIGPRLLRIERDSVLTMLGQPVGAA